MGQARLKDKVVRRTSVQRQTYSLGYPVALTNLITYSCFHRRQSLQYVNVHYLRAKGGTKKRWRVWNIIHPSKFWEFPVYGVVHPSIPPTIPWLKRETWLTTKTKRRPLRNPRVRDIFLTKIPLPFSAKSSSRYDSLKDDIVLIFVPTHSLSHWSTPNGGGLRGSTPSTILVLLPCNVTEGPDISRSEVETNN